MDRPDQSFTKKLIREVSQHPCLYNPLELGYKDRNKTGAEWNAVARNLDCTVQAAKTKWHNLRGSYSRSRNYQNPTSSSASAGGSKPQFYLANQLKFLEPYMGHRRRAGSFGTRVASLFFEGEDSQALLNKHLTPPTPPCFSPAPGNQVPLTPAIGATPTPSAGQPRPVTPSASQTRPAIHSASRSRPVTPSAGQDESEEVHNIGGKRRVSSTEEWKESARKFFKSRLEHENWPKDPDMDSLRLFLPHLAQLSARRKRQFLREAYNLILSLADEEEVKKEHNE